MNIQSTKPIESQKPKITPIDKQKIDQLDKIINDIIQIQKVKPVPPITNRTPKPTLGKITSPDSYREGSKSEPVPGKGGKIDIRSPVRIPANGIFEIAPPW